MRAILTGEVPSIATSYFAILTRKRRGLSSSDAMPHITRDAGGLVLDPAWLAAYRQCVGLPPDGVLPPLALQLAAAPLHLSLLADARFPFPALGLVHVSQRITQYAKVPDGARFSLSCSTEPATPSPRGMRFLLVTQTRIDGRLVQRAETLALAPSGGNAARTKPEAVPEPVRAPRIVADLEMPESIGRRYAAIAGDLNPIHQHALLAKPFGFSRAIVHGTYTLGRALAVSGLPAREAFVLDARFRRPVSLPSEVRVQAYSDDGVERVRVDASDGGAVHLEVAVSPL